MLDVNNLMQISIIESRPQSRIEINKNHDILPRRAISIRPGRNLDRFAPDKKGPLIDMDKAVLLMQPIIEFDIA